MSFPGAILLTTLLAVATPRPRPASPVLTPQGLVGKPFGKGVGKRMVRRLRVVDLFQINTREAMRLRFTDENGRPVRDVQRRANRFFRCHHTNRQGRMNSRLLRLLFETGRHWPGKRIEVVSGYRHPSVARNPHSPHMKGLACDFRVPGVDNEQLRDYLRHRFPHVGVGYYPNSTFVHLDVRQGASAFWIDYSGPGQDAVYSENPAEDLRTGRAQTFRPPAHVDPEWAEGQGTSASVPLPSALPSPLQPWPGANGQVSADAPAGAEVFPSAP